MNEQDIEYLIRSLGIGSTYRGYRYLNYGIKLCLEDEDYLLSVSKLLYPLIARHYRTTSYSVERDIRTIIKVCWERGNKRLLQEIALRPMHERPSCSEFLDILTAHLRQKSASRLVV
ncbi:sporulation initiation factor Spo0A C-terminal domain-containing protein [Bariatricus sp. SGI.154]|uniref:sporulation initiation factor Spo0A C-terminal domain-containing protein n=1 Tax=Bariatricus sp. SGI.154 TaxID=3420549 RepID=UPI003D03F810